MSAENELLDKLVNVAITFGIEDISENRLHGRQDL